MSETEIRGVIPNYYGLMIDKLNRIYDAWDKNDTYTALQRALKLCSFMPRKIKTELDPEKERIQKRLSSVSTITGYDMAIVKEKVMARLKQISNEELEKFVTTITDQLDENRLLTQGYGVPTRKTELKTLGDVLR